MTAFYLYFAGSNLLLAASGLAIWKDRSVTNALYFLASLLFTIGGGLLIWGGK